MQAVQPACVNRTAHVWGAVYHTYVGYKLIAIKVVLLSHDGWIYAGLL